MRVILLLCLTSVQAARLLGKTSKACMMERSVMGGARSEPSRGTACEACFKFQEGHAESKHVQPNAALCRSCYSIKSSCDDGQFAFSCLEENAQFEVMKKQQLPGSLYAPEDMHEEFKNKASELCTL